MLFHCTDTGASRSVFRYEASYMLLVWLSDSCIEKGQVDRIGRDKVITFLVVAYLNLYQLAAVSPSGREEGMSKDLVNGARARKH